MSLPLKWYLGRYPAYLDSVRRALRENPPRIAASGPGAAGCSAGASRPDAGVLADAERAIGIVFNYDLQAITDAFYFDTFATVGVDLTGIRIPSAEHDLSDRGAELKSTVHDSLRLFVDSSHSVHEIFAQVRDNVDQTSHAMAGIAAASTEVAQGAERQAMMLQRGRELADEVSAATARAQELSEQGVAAAGEANSVMQSVRVSGRTPRPGSRSSRRSRARSGESLRRSRA